MRICCPKKINTVSIIETIPNDILIRHVLPRVAASSYTDIINLKLSCKKLNEIVEDMYIYQHVHLDRIPIVQWKPLEVEERILLNKCRESENPEYMYRSSVVEYFSKTNPDLRSTYMILDRAVRGGHLGAYYVICIVLLLSGDEESKQKGIKLIGTIKNSRFMKTRLRLSRENLVKQLNEMWVKNPVVKERPAICCSAQHHHHQVVSWKINAWEEEEEEEEEEDDCDDQCEACIADRELKIICATYNWR